MDEQLTAFFTQGQDRINSALAEALPKTDPIGGEDLIDAMRYSLLNGGKRVRPILAYASAAAISPSAEPKNNDAVACAVESIHAYSLIHDDLPAMDDELDSRRPASHGR
jgi:geranylgeranyl pyrophosphate synthase